MEGFKLFAAGAQAFSIASLSAVCQGGRRKPNTRSTLLQSRTVTNGRAGEGNSRRWLVKLTDYLFIPARVALQDFCAQA